MNLSSVFALRAAQLSEMMQPALLKTRSDLVERDGMLK